MQSITNEDKLNPDKAWSKLSVKIKVNQVARMPLDTPIFADKVRFVCISDTHGRTDRLGDAIPDGDILIHAGDFTSGGALSEVQMFNKFLGTLKDKFKYIVVIAGNHELSFDKTTNKSLFKKYANTTNELSVDPRSLLTNCTFLEDNDVTLYGIKIYGSPWQPWFGGWAFNVERDEILKKWDKIPTDTSVLITHGPPLGFGDIVTGGYHVGCYELLNTVRERIKPKYHIFGHIHEDPGIWSDTTTTYINASTCDKRYRPIQAPIIFDFDLPNGIGKTSSS